MSAENISRNNSPKEGGVPLWERRRNIYGGLALVVLLVLAFLSGKYFTPTRVEERVRVEKVEVEKVVIQEKVRVEKVVVEKKVEVVRRVVVERKTPDGTTEKTTTEDLATKTDSGSWAQAEADAWAERVAASHATQEATRTVERHDPMWKVGLLGGASLGGQGGYLGGLQGGVRLGPVWVSAQAQTDARTRVDFLLGVALEL